MRSKELWVAGVILVVVGALALTAPRLRSQSSHGDSIEKFQRSFDVVPGAALNVDNYKGTIHITGSDSNQVVVDVTKKFDGFDSDRKWWMENVQVNFHNGNDHVSIEVKYPNVNCGFCFHLHESNAEVELEIKVPRQINVRLESYKPDIEIAGIQGDIRIKSYKSPIILDSTTGAVSIDTYKDEIKLRNASVHGTLEIRSYKADAEIEAKGLGDNVTIESAKGSTILRLPGNTGLDVDFEGGRRSTFHSDFAIAAKAGSVNNSESSVRGVINQGGTHVRLRTEKGLVALEKSSQ
jgi:hypothetical protein